MVNPDYTQMEEGTASIEHLESIQIYTSSSNSNDNTSLLSIQTTSIEATIIPSSPIPTQNRTRINNQ
nr:10625_t:CDS:2 [Entrophospora candida]